MHKWGTSKLDRAVLVLNRYNMALGMIPVRRAIVLLYVNRAEVLDVEGGGYSTYSFWEWVKVSSSDGDDAVHAVSFSVKLPSVIRLLFCDRLPDHRVPLTRRNVFLRDGYRCQYCGRKLPPSMLSIDHVVPLSRGGRETWTNVVCACLACNSRKGGRTPEEVSMKLLKPPRTPSFLQTIRSRFPERIPEVWAPFLGGE